MQGILKARHRVICDHLRDIGMRQHVPDDELTKLGTELTRIYQNYQQRIEEIKTVVTEYNQKQREIRNKMKKIVRKEMSNSEFKEYSV